MRSRLGVLFLLVLLMVSCTGRAEDTAAPPPAPPGAGAPVHTTAPAGPAPVPATAAPTTTTPLPTDPAPPPSSPPVEATVGPPNTALEPATVAEPPTTTEPPAPPSTAPPSTAPQSTEPPPSTTAPPPPTTTTTRPPPPADWQPLLHGAPFYAAHAVADPIVLFAEPDGSEKMRLPKHNEEGGIPYVFRILEEYPGWFRVMLPTRPNGSEAWVRTGDVEWKGVRHRVEIHVSAMRVDLFDDQQLLASWPAGVGQDQYPTPTGNYYALEKWTLADPSGPFGPHAVGISSHSDVLDEFAGGDGRVAIHGTNQPELIPGKISHGCIRLYNEHITALHDRLELGAPVDVYG